jgi:hypothetical protein
MPHINKKTGRPGAGPSITGLRGQRPTLSRRPDVKHDYNKHVCSLFRNNKILRALILLPPTAYITKHLLK